MVFRTVSEENRNLVNAFITKHWYSTDMIIRGEAVDMTAAEGFFMELDGNITALITYMISGEVCEITSLDSLTEGQGIGSSLVDKVINTAREHKCSKVIVVTTNDNIYAIRFYQKRGFDMARLYHDSLVRARELKPYIPHVGESGIPIRHEIEFEMTL